MGNGHCQINFFFTLSLRKTFLIFSSSNGSQKMALRGRAISCSGELAQALPIMHSLRPVLSPLPHFLFPSFSLPLGLNFLMMNSKHKLLMDLFSTKLGLKFTQYLKLHHFFSIILLDLSLGP